MLKIMLVKQSEQTKAELISSLVTLEKSLFHRNIAWDAGLFFCFLRQNDTQLIVLINSDDPKQTVHGYCLYRQHEKDIDILSVGVSSSTRGHNYGYSMLKHTLDSSSNKPGFLITIDCMPSLMKYYEKMGFEEYGKRESAYYELSDDEIEGVHMKVSKATFDAVALNRSATTAALEEVELEEPENNIKPSGCS